MDYQGNSHKNKDKVMPEGEKKQIEKVVTGVVVVKKPSIRTRFKHIFLGADSKSAGRYLAEDVIIPAIRNLIVDSATKGVERVVYGDSRPYRRTGMGYTGRVQYNSPLLRQDPRGSVRLPDQPPRSPNRSATDLVLASRDEAELVVERLGDILEQYDVASVADLNDLVGLPVSPIDNKWGWTNLSSADVRQVREGYLISLPQVEEI